MSRVINGRVADESDVRLDGAIFYIPNGMSIPYSFDHELPVRVRFINPDGDGFPQVGTVVEILQAEQTDDGSVILGFVYNGCDYVCALEDVQIMAADE
jgi:hypothetical protein